MRSKQKNTQERGENREYDVTLSAHIRTQWYMVTTRLSLPVQIQYHHTCSSVGKPNTYWVGDSVGETCLWCLTLVSERQQVHCSTAFLSSNKALAHDSASTNLKMYHWIDIECRKPQMGTQCQRNQRMKGCILTPRNTWLSCGTSVGTFAVFTGPYRNYHAIFFFQECLLRSNLSKRSRKH